jgi:hypothetical protein
MAHVSSLLAAFGCLVSLASASEIPAGYPNIVPGSPEHKTLEGKTLYPLEWRGVLEAGKPEAHLKDQTFGVSLCSLLDLYSAIKC